MRAREDLDSLGEDGISAVAMRGSRAPSNRGMTAADNPGFERSDARA
jgi:hypothetical protein